MYGMEEVAYLLYIKDNQFIGNIVNLFYFWTPNIVYDKSKISLFFTIIQSLAILDSLSFM